MTGKTFIWDLDGTLLDSYGVIASSLRQTLEELGVPMEEDEIRRRATEGSVSDVVAYAAAATGRAFQEILSTPTGGAPPARCWNTWAWTAISRKWSPA